MRVSKIICEIRVFIEDPNTKQNVEVTVELQLNLDSEMFEKLYAHSKAHLELELLRKKEPMAQTSEFIKEICDTFPDIKFDSMKSCFYNESEEIALWSAHGKRNDEIKEYSSFSKRTGCDCCTIT